jgi:outer membrane protein insertion porin family
LTSIRVALLAASCLSIVVTDPAWAQQARGRPSARPVAARPTSGTIQAIKVEGNQRIEEGTIRSYMLVQPGDPFDPDRIDRSLKTLYATGLFQDVTLTRQGDTLVVKVVENPIVNRIAFEGNHKLTDEQLRAELQLRSRAVFTPALAQSDRQRILNAYAKKGRYNVQVEPQIIRLDQNRVDVVFDIHEGESTLISRIAFVGNHEFSEDRLKEVVSSRQGAWWRFPSNRGPL